MISSKQNCTNNSPVRFAPLTPHILIVDDEPLVCEQLRQLLTREAYRITVAASAEQALQLLQAEDTDLVLADLRLPGLDGVELTKQISLRWNDIPVIIVTGYAEIETAVQVLKIGACDYIVKPFSAAAILEAVRMALEKAGSNAEIRQLRRQIREGYRFGNMLSKSPEMHRIFEIIRIVAPTDTTIVVEGETGTGKELVARTIHQLSPYGNGPLITINCGGLPETLLESELFGYERGAFTGADQSRPGKIELAEGGTLFLDEIENMPLSMQAKLLLVLNDRTVQRLGSSHRTRVNMRLVAASNVPIKELMIQQKMRSDFYFRIAVVPLRLPPLRERLGDLPTLIQDFLSRHTVALEKKIINISPEALEHLRRYSWPGNIRELQNVLEKAVLIAKSHILNLRDLDVDLLNASAQSGEIQRNVSANLPLQQWIREQEKAYLVQKLAAFRGRIDLTAKSCGVDVRTLHRKMQLFGLDKKAFNTKSGANLEPKPIQRGH